MLTKAEVKDFMTTQFITLKTDMDVVDAIKLLMTNRITGAPVSDLQGDIVGMFTEMDCMKVVLETAYNQNFGGKVEEFMSKDIPSVNGTMSIPDAADKFTKTSARNFPVMDDVELVGVISRTDVLRALLAL